MNAGPFFLDVFDKNFIEEIAQQSINLINQSNLSSDVHKPYLRQIAGYLLQLGLKVNSEKLIKKGEELLNSQKASIQATNYQNAANYCFHDSNIDDSLGKRFLEKAFALWKQVIVNPKDFNLISSGSNTPYLKFLKILKDNDLVEILTKTKEISFSYLERTPLKQQPVILCKIVNSLVDIEGTNQILGYLERGEQKLREAQHSLTGGTPLNYYLDLLLGVAKATKDQTLINDALKLIKSTFSYYIPGPADIEPKLKVIEALHSIGEKDESIERLQEIIQDLQNNWEECQYDETPSRMAKKSLLQMSAEKVAETCLRLKQITLGKELAPILIYEAERQVRRVFTYWNRQGLLFKLQEKTEKDLKKEIEQWVIQFKKYCTGDYFINQKEIKEQINGSTFDLLPLLRGANSRPPNPEFYAGQMIFQELSFAYQMLKNLSLETLAKFISDTIREHEAHFLEKRSRFTKQERLPIPGQLSEKLNILTPKIIVDSFSSGNTAQALKLLESYERQIQEVRSKHNLRASSELELAKLYYDLKLFDKALEIFNKYKDGKFDEFKEVSTHRHNFALTNFLTLKIKLDSYLGHKIDKDTIIKPLVEKNDRIGLTSLGLAFVEIGQIEVAREILSILSSFRSTDLAFSEYYLQKAQILRQIDKKEDAVQSLDQYLSIIKNEMKSIQDSRDFTNIFHLNSKLVNEDYFVECLLLGAEEKLKELILFFFNKPKKFLYLKPYSFGETVYKKPPPDSNIQLWYLAKDLFEQELEKCYRNFKIAEDKYTEFSQIVFLVKMLLKSKKYSEVEELGLSVLSNLQSIIKLYLDLETQQKIKIYQIDKGFLWQPHKFLETIQKKPIKVARSGTNVTVLNAITNIPHFTETVYFYDASLLPNDHYAVYFKLNTPKDVYNKVYAFVVYKFLSQVFQVISKESLMKLCEHNSKILLQLLKTNEYASFSPIYEIKQALKKEDYLAARSMIKTFLKTLTKKKNNYSDAIEAVIVLFDLLANPTEAYGLVYSKILIS
ncbi:MAG: tetratricopeptide repeat protein [Promethearchaeota archaeon]